MATIKDIAIRAGVSAATVSHVVNKSRYVSPTLVDKVEKAIQEADVPPNFVVKKRIQDSQLQINRRVIYFLVSEIGNPYNSGLEICINESVSEKDYILVSICLDNENSRLLFEKLVTSSSNTAGVILSMNVYDLGFVNFLKRIHIPMVIVGSRINGICCDRVSSANVDGAYNATVHLIRSGHEQIAMLCGSSISESNIDRINGFKKALKDNGIPFSAKYIVKELQSEDDVNKALAAFFRMKPNPTALFVANYKTMISVVKYIKNNGIECPKDISIVGFNDFPWASVLDPPITTVNQNIVKLSETASDMLLSRIETQNTTESDRKINEIEIPTDLKVRNSTCGIGRGPFGEKAADISQLKLSEEESKKCKQGNFTAAISFHYTGKAWMRLTEQGIRSVFDALNISLIVITDANFDVDLQNKQLESIRMLSPDVLISVPTDSQKTTESFRKISQTKTKMVFIANVPEGIERGEFSSCISVNERSHGRNMGRGLGEYMKNSNKSKIGILKYREGFYATNQRDMAGEQILVEEYPELKICSVKTFSSDEEAYNSTIEMIKGNQDIAGIYVSWEGPAQSVMKALTDIKRLDIAISTGDLEYDTAMNMARGGMVKAISAQCPFEQGQAVALCAANVLIGKEVPSFIGIEPIYVDRTNLKAAWQKVYKEEIPEQIEEYL